MSPTNPRHSHLAWTVLLDLHGGVMLLVDHLDGGGRKLSTTVCASEDDHVWQLDDAKDLHEDAVAELLADLARWSKNEGPSFKDKIVPDADA